MVKKILICVVATIAAWVINPAFSQPKNKSLPGELGLSYQGETPQSPVSGPGYLNDINPRAKRSFIRRFDEAQGERWYKVANGYIAYFEKDNIQIKVSYDIGGTWVNTMRSYTEKYLLLNVRHSVKRIYYDFNISQVTEVESDDQPLTYIIELREISDENVRKKIMYSEGEIMELDLSKGKSWQKSLTRFPRKP